MHILSDYNFRVALAGALCSRFVHDMLSAVPRFVPVGCVATIATSALGAASGYVVIESIYRIAKNIIHERERQLHQVASMRHFDLIAHRDAFHSAFSGIRAQFPHEVDLYRKISFSWSDEGLAHSFVAQFLRGTCHGQSFSLINTCREAGKSLDVGTISELSAEDVFGRHMLHLCYADFSLIEQDKKFSELVFDQLLRKDVVSLEYAGDEKNIRMYNTDEYVAKKNKLESKCGLARQSLEKFVTFRLKSRTFRANQPASYYQDVFNRIAPKETLRILGIVDIPKHVFVFEKTATGFCFYDTVQGFFKYTNSSQFFEKLRYFVMHDIEYMNKDPFLSDVQISIVKAKA